MRILVLEGGTSPERAVSLQSAENVKEALRSLGHEVVSYDTGEGLSGMQRFLPGTDVVFPVLHGKDGEDGVVQAFLDDQRIPYVGSGAEASRTCFDKILTKQILEENSLPTPRWAEVTAATFADHPLTQAPYVLKPRDGGSSIDTFIIRQPGSQTVPFTIFEAYSTMLLEELITGTELSVSVLNQEALAVTEIIPPAGKEFDFENKYNGATKELCPPENIPIDIQEHAQSLAEEAHFYSGSRHYSRVDFMMSHHGELFILEINTIPGMTKESIFPKAAAAVGIPFSELVEQLVGLALTQK